MLNIIQKLKTYLFLLKYRKEIKYFYRSGNVPLCGCSKYLKTGTCKHIEEARLIINKFIKGND